MRGSRRRWSTRRGRQVLPRRLRCAFEWLRHERQGSSYPPCRHSWLWGGAALRAVGHANTIVCPILFVLLGIVPKSLFRHGVGGLVYASGWLSRQRIRGLDSCTLRRRRWSWRSRRGRQAPGLETRDWREGRIPLRTAHRAVRVIGFEGKLAQRAHLTANAATLFANPKQ